MTEALHFASVVLPAGADSSVLAAAVEHAIATGAHPVVVPMAIGAPRPEGVQVVTVSEGMALIGVLRRALAALANTPATGLLLWDAAVRGDDASALAVLDRVREQPAPIVIPMDGGEALTPVWYARDTWLELMTVAEQGLDAVQDRYRMRSVRVEVGHGVA